MNEKSNIVKFDKKHEYCDASFYYGNDIKTSRKILTKILGKPDHVGHDECEWDSSSVEWWRMLKLSSSNIIPFKIYDSNILSDINDMLLNFFFFFRASSFISAGRFEISSFKLSN